ncbi:hypothetical protein [Neptunicella sp. SCSIO 80796]|uniref:hypothetical protein n=1 Tax=Neptunicella plasticusilytica TaxID=3117012 RepID=UPI003A4DC2D9
MKTNQEEYEMRSTVLKSLFLILVFLSPLFNLAFADELDDFITPQMQQREIPGLQLAVVRHNKIIRTGSYGLASIETAIAGYQKVLELQPDNHNAIKQLDKLKQIQSEKI